jgi:hypothetical protein
MNMLLCTGTICVLNLCVTPVFITLQKKQAAEPYSNFVKGRSSFNGTEKVSCAFGLIVVLGAFFLLSSHAMKDFVTVFSVLTLYSLLGRSRCFGGASCLHLKGSHLH